MRSRTSLAAVLIGLLVSVSGPAMAAKGFSYSYADVGYLATDGDELEVDSVLVDASFGVFEYVALRGGFRRGWVNDYPGDSPDLTEFRVGARGHYTLLKKLDVYADAIYFNSKLNGNQTTQTDIGGIYEAGLRYQLAKKFELDASYRHVSGEIDADFLVVGGILNVTKNISLNLNGAFADEDSEYFAGIRIDF